MRSCVSNLFRCIDKTEQTLTELQQQVSQPCEIDYCPDRGFDVSARHHFTGSSPCGAINAGLFLSYCAGVEITGSSYTTAQTQTLVQVNELELLAKLEVCQVWQSTNQNSNLTVTASRDDRQPSFSATTAKLLQIPEWNRITTITVS